MRALPDHVKETNGGYGVRGGSNVLVWPSGSEAKDAPVNSRSWRGTMCARRDRHTRRTGTFMIRYAVARPRLARAMAVGALIAFSGACADSGSAEAGDTASAAGAISDSSWAELQPGVQTRDFVLASDGTLSWRGRLLSPSLPSRSTDGANTPVTYRVSPTNASERWVLVEGRDSTFSNVYVVDLERGTIRPTPVTKYGIAPWVAWAPGLPYAVVSNRIEGTALLYRIDARNGEAKQIEFDRVISSPLSATPLEPTLEWVRSDGSSFAIDARVACNSAVERCDGAPDAETKRFEVDLRTLRVTGTGS